MSTTKIQTINKTVRKKTSKEKSLPRIKTFSSPGRLLKLEAKKSAAFPYENEGKDCVNSSKIPKPQVSTSYSCNETLESNLGKSKTKKAPSMIPRSKSRKRNESDKVKFELSSKRKSSKEELNKTLASKSKKSFIDLTHQESEYISLSNVEVIESSVFGEIGRENRKAELIEKTSQNLNSCREFLEVKVENSELSFKDAEKNLPSVDPSFWNRLPRQVKDLKDGENNEKQTEKQHRTIRNLYETIKAKTGPLFESLKWSSPKKISNNELESKVIEEAKTGQESITNFLKVQDDYEFTIKEISNIWRNTLSLIASVKDHTVKFVEESNTSVDKEQLALEAEMLQLAIDFAISYSKLKTDFLIKSVKKSLNIKDLEKSELEAFIDSKTFAAVYSDEDLAAMAKTVQDLNLSVLKGEDTEFE